MATIITVYTKPDCRQCEATKRWLDKRNMQYRTVDLTTDSAAHAAVTELGYMQAPVVIVNNGYGDVHWGGFRPDMLGEHVKVAA